MAVVINKAPALVGSDLKEFALPDREEIREKLAGRIQVEAVTYDSERTKLRDDAVFITPTQYGYELDVSIADVEDAISQGLSLRSANLLEGVTKPTITFRFKLDHDFDLEGVEYHLSETTVLKNFSFEQADSFFKGAGAYSDQVKLLRRAAKAFIERNGSSSELTRLTGIDFNPKAYGAGRYVRNMDDVTKVLMEAVSQAAGELVSKFPTSAIYRTTVPMYEPRLSDMQEFIAGQENLNLEQDQTWIGGRKDHYSMSPIDGHGGRYYLRVSSPMIKPADLKNLSILKAIISGKQIPDHTLDAQKVIDFQNDPSTNSDEKYHIFRAINDHFVTQAKFQKLIDGETLPTRQILKLFTREIPALPGKDRLWGRTLEALTASSDTLPSLLDGIKYRGGIMSWNAEKDRAARTSTFIIRLPQNEQIRTEVAWSNGADMHVADDLARACALLKYIAPELRSEDIAKISHEVFELEDVPVRYAEKEAIGSKQKSKGMQQSKPKIADELSRLDKIFEGTNAQSKIFKDGVREILKWPQKALWLATKWIEAGKIETGSNKLRGSIGGPMILFRDQNGSEYPSLSRRKTKRPSDEITIHRARAEALVGLVTGISDPQKLKAYIDSVTS